jgi:outer membrane biogenesis lipoprotein LolB
LKNGIQIIITSIILLFLIGCKSSKIVTSSGEVANLSTKNIIKNHYRNTLKFKTIRGKLKVSYNDGKTQESFTLSLRMKKDEAIWLSATLSLVKVYITPQKVSFYNKLDNTYFEGDFSLISKFLGTELDFEKVQNLLIGNALFDLKNERFNSVIQNKNYALTPKRDFELFKRLFLLDPFHFKVKQQRLEQSAKNRLLTIDYPAYQEITGQAFPKNVEIKAEEVNKKTTIQIEYRKITFNENVRFPFKIPNGYKEIKI